LPPSLLALSYFVHLIATVVWIGGLVILSVLVVPAARRTLATSPEARRFYSQLRRRFFPLANLSLVVLLLTGIAQMSANEHYDGVLQFDNDWSRALLLKHIAFVGMIVCGLAMQYGVAPALERAILLTSHGKGSEADVERLERRESRLAWLNLGLGIAVLAFTAWATAL